MEPFLQQAAFDWTAALDILLVAALLYYFLRVVKDTRALPMLLAAVLLLGLYYAAQGWRLETLRWLLSSPVVYFVVFALLVIYQGEIRRELARLGRLPLLGRFAARERTEPLDDIVLACSYFTQNKIGALVVLEREIGLGTYVESGIALDALLSYDLLISIFHTASPLHDGAAIVKKNRVVAASCFLPLSLNPLLSTKLGTRHRAAIGVTEESDAVAVVVSEETGAIAVMSAGTVDLNLTPEQLRERLRRLLRERLPRLTLPGRAGPPGGGAD
ncbi:MAG: diadenylate cyclase CdaA [Candidatus Acidiferrales bacterium]